MPSALSIIVPVYNVATLLPRCLDSILRQEFRDFELICVNDGSTDDSLSILQQYASRDGRVKVVLSQDNCGLSVTRNRGMEVATGEYIGFCDADDSIDADFFAKLISAAQRYGADIAMAGTKLNATDAVTQPTGVHEALADKIASLPNGSVWDKIYRGDLIRKNNLRFPAGLFWEDNDFLIRAVFHAKKLAVIDDTFYNYMENPKSIRRDSDVQKELKRNVDALHVSHQLLAFAHRNGFDDAAMLEFHKFIRRTLPWWDMFSNPRMLARIDRLEEETAPRDRIFKLFGRIPVIEIRNTGNRSTWRLFGRITLARIEDMGK